MAEDKFFELSHAGNADGFLDLARTRHTDGKLAGCFRFEPGKCFFHFGPEAESNGDGHAATLRHMSNALRVREGALRAAAAFAFVSRPPLIFHGSHGSWSSSDVDFKEWRPFVSCDPSRPQHRHIFVQVVLVCSIYGHGLSPVRSFRLTATSKTRDEIVKSGSIMLPLDLPAEQLDGGLVRWESPWFDFSLLKGCLCKLEASAKMESKDGSFVIHRSFLRVHYQE